MLKLKKVIGFLLCFFFMLQITIPVKFVKAAGTSTSITYSLSNNTILTGDTFDILVNVSGVSNLYAGSMDFKYDPSLIQVLSVSQGNLLPNAYFNTPINDVINGNLSVFSTPIGNNAPTVTGSGVLFKITVKALKVGSINLNTIMNNSQLSNNGNNMRIKLSDKVGGGIAYSTQTKSIDINNILLNKIEEDDTNIVYVGSWYNDPHPSFSSGNEKYTVNGSATFSFTGTGVRIVTCTGPNRGIAKITIDGVAYNVDLYSTDFEFKRVIFEKFNLSPGTHTVKIQGTGTKNSSSSGNYVLVDAVQFFEGNVIDPIPVNKVEENNINIKYTGTWINDYNAGLSGGNEKYTNSGSLSFSFNGTGINLLTCTGPNRGIAKITIDGVSYNVDMYSPSYEINDSIFNKLNLSSGEHSVKVETTGTKNPVSTGTYIFVDAFEIVNGNIVSTTKTNLVEENNTNIAYTGTWLNDPLPSFSGGNEKYTGNGSLSFTFTGTGIRLITCPGPNRGIAKVTIDGVAYTVDMYSSDYLFKRNIFEKLDLPSGTHSIKIETIGAKNPISSGYNIFADAFEIVNGNITAPISFAKVEEDNLNIVYTGSWINDPNAGLSGGNEKYTTSGSLSFSFTGTGIRLAACTGPNRGIAKITIDGNVYNVDMFTSSYEINTVFETLNLSSGTHTVKVETTGTKNSSSTGTNIFVDSFGIANGNIVNSTVFNSVEEDNVNISYTGSWLDDSLSKFSGGNEKYTGNGSLSFTFTGTGVRLIACPGPNRGIAKVTIDGAIYNVDMYASDYLFKKNVFEKLNLPSGTHNIKIETTGSKNPASSGYNIFADAFEIANGNIQNLISVNRIEESAVNLRYIGPWLNDVNAGFSEGNEKYTKNGSLTFTFTGTGIRLITCTGPNRGIAKITIDGVSYDVDMFASTYEFNKNVFEKLGLSAGNHTVKIETTGTKNIAATDTNVFVDAIDIIK